jgi:hypothetical membrane protein
VISRLGAAESGGRVLMNTSFVVQGLLILGGLLLLRPALLGRGAQVATAMLGAAAVGVAVVGLFPLGDDDTWHRFGAFLYLLGSGVGLIGLAYAVRPRSEVLGTVLALLGLLTTAMTVFYVVGVTGLLGEGGTERAAAYPLPIGLALAAVGLLRLGNRPLAAGGSEAGGEDGAPTDRRALKEQERAERARRARERDEALEAAAARAAAGEHAGTDGAVGAEPARLDATGSGDPAEDDDDFDPDDPWATPRRQRDA